LDALAALVAGDLGAGVLIGYLDYGMARWTREADHDEAPLRKLVVD
jgi:hypothetical protein